MNKKIYEIGVAIPAYNQEVVVGVLLRNLLLQKGDNFIIKKIIIASDGSTDKTEDVVQCFTDKRIELLSGRSRIGLNQRRNQIFEKLQGTVDFVLLLDMDDLPEDENFISKIIDSTPQDKQFSIMVVDTKPIKASNFFSKITNCGFDLVHEILLKSEHNSFYLASGCKLFSAQFAEKFQWKTDFNGNSYCYRKAQESGLPIIFNSSTTTFFSPTQNLSDFLNKSVEFHRNKKIESQYSDIYDLDINWLSSIWIFIKKLAKHPIVLSLYILLFLYAQIYSRLIDEYAQFRSVYSATA